MKQENQLKLETQVRFIKGVGPIRAQSLSRLGIFTIADILYYLPRRHEDRANIKKISEIKGGTFQTIIGKIFAIRTYKTKRNINVFQIAVSDSSGIISAIWYNQPFLKQHFKVNQNVSLYGRAEKYGKLTIIQPEYEIVNETNKQSIHIGRIVPIYSLTQDISQRYLRNLAYSLVNIYANHLTDMLPAKIIVKNKLVDIKFAVKSIHFPTSFENLDRAYQRIVFDEFFILQLAIHLKRREVAKRLDGIAHRTDKSFFEEFSSQFPFKLTDSQIQAMKDITKDMEASKPMNRLLEGEVGSGKTIVAAYAIFISAKNGFQAAVLAPTEILAKQHYLNLSKMLMKFGITTELLISDMSSERKREAIDSIKNKNVDVIVGTHAILQETVSFNDLGVIIIDEQHKFGVNQRAVLREKAKKADLLLMTATPIPRTLALTVYGDLDISVMKELPSERKPIATYWISEKERVSMYTFLKEELKNGRQGYIVYPRVESQRDNVKSAVFMFEELKNTFSDFKLGLLHGKLSAEQKDKIMDDFKDGKIQILISTVIIEVGIDVKNATFMVVENADRFGLAQLHQLRGRIGRGAYSSYCILVAEPDTEISEKRIKTMVGTESGLEIAEQDLQLRGSGDFFGTDQHGLPQIRFGDILKDIGIMEKAKSAANELLNEDPGLDNVSHRHIRKCLFDKFKDKMDLIKVA